MQKTLEMYSHYHVTCGPHIGEFRMVRLSKTARDRHVSYKRPRLPGKKGPSGIVQKAKVHANAIPGELALTAFIPKI